MPILFFDTETTGLPDRTLPAGHPKQPYLVQLAALLTDDMGLELMSLSVIINPEVPIPEGASRVHGITDDVAVRLGMPVKTALRVLERMSAPADCIVAHNVKFDMALIETACARIGWPRPQSMRNTFCTMEAASPIVNLPPTDRMRAAGFDKPKPPKLEECIRHFFGEGLDGAHDALVDVRACARVFFYLKSLESAE